MANEQNTQARPGESQADANRRGRDEANKNRQSVHQPLKPAMGPEKTEQGNPEGYSAS